MYKESRDQDQQGSGVSTWKICSLTGSFFRNPVFTSSIKWMTSAEIKIRIVQESVLIVHLMKARNMMKKTITETRPTTVALSQPIS
jgi:hypothetical protein